MDMLPNQLSRMAAELTVVVPSFNEIDNVEPLIERLRDDERALVSIVLREVARLNALVTDFLEYARPQTAASRRGSPTRR